MNQNMLVLLTLVAGLLNACALSSKEKTAEVASSPAGFVLTEPAPGKALIYFYRDKDDNWADRSPKISMGERSLFEAKYHRYKKFELTPGEYEIQTTGYELGNSVFKTKFESGKTYFIQYSAKAGRESGRHLYLVSSNQGQKEVQGFTEMD